MEDLFGLEDDDDDIRANALGSDSILDTPSKNVEGFRDFVKSGGAQKRQANQDNLIGFKDFVKSEGENHRKQQANLALFNASSQNPDQAAKDLSIAQAENLPVEVIQSDRPFYKAQDQFNKSLNDSLDLPSTRSWLANNQEYAPLAQDTLAQLGLIEKSVRNLVGATVGLAGMSGASAGTSVAITSRVMERLPLPEFIDPLWEGLEYVGESLESGGDVVVDFSQDRIQSQDNKFDMTVAGFGQMLGQMGALKYSAKLAWPLMVAMGMYESRRLIEDDPDSAGSSQAIQDFEVVLGGVETAITEMASTYAQLKLFKVPAAMGVTNKLKANLIKLAGGAASEGLQETMESMLRDYVHSALSADDEYELEDSFGQAIKEGEIGSYVGLVTQLFLNGIRGTRARRDKKFFDDLNKASEDQPLKDRSQKAYESMAEAVTEHISQDNETGEPITEFHVNAETFKQTMAELDATPEQIELMFPGMTEQLDEAILENDDVTVPVANFVGRVAGSDVGNALSPHLRRDGNALSLTEQIAAEKEAGSFTDIITKGAEKIIADQKTTEEFKASANEVKNIIEGQLNAAGRFSKDVNKKYAEFVRDFYITQAQATGISPSEYYERYPYKVSDGSIPATSDADVLTQAKNAGYLGADPSEASEWLRSIEKGLDMSLEARMERGDEQNYSPTFYHATATNEETGLGDVTEFDPNRSISEFNRGQSYDNLGVWMTNNPGSQGAGIYTPPEGGAVYPLRHKAQNLKETSFAHIPKRIEQFGGIDGYRDHLRSQGYDGIKIISSPEHDAGEFFAQDAIVVFDPSNVRSVNAAFDPDFVDSSNLLAQAQAQGYQGESQSESVEWLRSIEKGLDMSAEARFARAEELGHDTDTPFYHANIGGIEGEGFDNNRLPKHDPDRPFNAHWFGTTPSEFASYPNTGNTITPVFLALKNEAPQQVWRKVARDVKENWGELSAQNPNKSSADVIRERLVEMGYTHAIRGRDKVNAEELKRTGTTTFKSSTGEELTLTWGKLLTNPPPPNYTEQEINDIRAYNEAKNQFKVWQDRVMEAVSNGTISDLNQEEGRALGEEMARLETIATEANLRAYKEADDQRQELDSLRFSSESVGEITGYENLEDYESSEPEIEDVAVFDTSIIRSIHAAFDPDYADSSNLLAQSAKMGGFVTKQSATGWLKVYGNNEDIRAVIPGDLLGTPIEGGAALRFTPNNAHRVLSALVGEDVSYGRIQIHKHEISKKTGRYKGAPAKANTAAKLKPWQKQLQALAEEGAEGRYWYEWSGEAILEMTGGDVAQAKQFIGLLAIYSPQAKVDTNGTFALRAWAQYKAGQPIKVKTKVMDKAATEFLYEGKQWKGEKTGNFYANLLRSVDPAFKSAQGSTIDMWMMRAGQYNKDAPNKSEYRFMEIEVNKLANKLGWEPHQVQAAIWVAMKARMENKQVKADTNAYSLKRGWAKRGPKGLIYLKEFQDKHFTSWVKHGFAHEPTANDTKLAKFDFSDAVRRHIGQMSWEARPSTNSVMLPGIHKATHEQLIDFQLAIQNALSNEFGVDLLAQYLGILADGSGISPGIWEGIVSPSTQMGVSMAPTAGKYIYTNKDGEVLTQKEWEDFKKGEQPEGYTKSPIIDPAQKDILDTYAAVMGLLLRQDGVGYHKPFFGETLGMSNGVDVRLDRTISPDEAKSLEVDLRKAAEGTDFDADNIALISSPTGVRFLKLKAWPDKKHTKKQAAAVKKHNESSNTEFHKLIESSLDSLNESGDIKYFASDGNLVGNNWKEALNGEDYQQGISDRGRSDVLGWARDVLYPEVQSVFHEFSKKHDWGEVPEIEFDIQEGVFNQKGVFNQGQVAQTDTAEFKEWAGTDQVIDSDEINSTDFSGEGPFVMKAFHATTHDVQEFDSSVKGNPDGQFGQVNYFTSSDYDAETNYLEDGKDLTNRVERKKDEIALEISFIQDAEHEKPNGNISQAIFEKYGVETNPTQNLTLQEKLDIAEQLAKKELIGDGSQVMEVYLKTEKPFVIVESSGGAPILELFNYETVNNASIEQAAEQSGIDEAVLRDLIEKGDSVGYRNATEEEQKALDLVEDLRWEIQEQESDEVFQAIRDVAIRYDIDGAELLGDLYEKLSDELSEGSVEHGLLEGILRENEDVTGAYDYDNGESVGNNIIRDIIKELGYDSIILKDAEQRFSGMEMARGTAHIHIFDANNTNIKSVDNAGTFDPSNPNIYAQPGWHGTGNGIFDKFSLEAMGTGEGAQAYGWGMYFAGKRSIAEWYRDKLSGGQWDIFFNGKKLGSPSSIRNSFMMLLYKTPTNPDEFIAAQVGFIKSDPLVMDAISDGSATWSEVLHEEVGRALDMDGTKDFASEVHAKIDGFDVDSVEVKFKGELYEVNLPEDSELMVWDGMLKNMSAPVQEKIKAAILSIGAPPDGLVINLDGTVDPDISGRIVYEYISEHFRENAVFAYPALTDIGDDVWDETEKDTSLLLNKHGIPGLMYEDGTSRGNKKGTTSNYVIWDEDVVTIESVNDEKRQAELLEQNKRDAVRGTFDPSKLLTTLNEDADYTTFLHESAHFFLTVYADQAGQENAPLRTTEDMQTLLDWFGVKDLATWNSMSIDEQRKFHEQFAMSFEGYLMEGKAPSVKMQGLFDRFAAWLRNAYRSIKDLNEIFKKEFGHDMPIMTGEVRQVMDRMLASEDQITQAKEVQNMMPMYENQEDSDMDDEEWTDYKAAQQEADDAANMKLGQDNARQVKWLSNAKSKIIARMQSKVRGLRKEAREDIAAEVTSQSVYRAVQFFRRGEIVNEDGEIEKVEEHKLDSTAIKEFYEDTPVDEVPDLGNLKGMTKQGGIAPDVAAQLMNYQTVDEMIKDLTEAKPVKQEIDEQVDAFMLENHGELMDQKAIDAAVDSALHTEARSRLLSTELRHLAKSGQPVRVLTEAAKRSAQMRLEGKKFVDVRPKKYIAAEARSSKAVFNALQRGDTEGAIQAKREQLLNNQLAIESQKIVDEFEKGRVRANKSQKKSAQKKMRGEFLLQLNHLYGRFDLRKSVSLKEQTEERKPIADWITAETEKMAAAMPGLPGWILDDSLKKSYKQMNILEFRDLMDAVTQLETLARREENMYQAVRNQTYEQEISSILAEFEEANPDAFEEPGVPKRYRKDDKPYNERLSASRWAGFDGEFINVENLLDMMTGGKGKKVFESLFSRISKAQDNRNELMLKIGNMLNDVTNAYTIKERHNMSGSRSEKGWQTSTGRYLTRENRIMVGIYNGSVEGQQRLRDGNGYTEVEMEEIIDSLEEKDINLIKKFWQVSEEVIWPKLKAVDERTVGIAAPKVIATPYMTRFGEIGGGYAPLVYDGDMDNRVYDLKKAESVGDLLGGVVHSAATARSASHERLDTVDKYLDLRLTSMSSKINETIHDVTHREAIADTYRLLQNDKIAQVMKTLAGPDVYRSITDRVRMVAKKPHQPTGLIDTALWHIRKNTLIGMMALSFNTVAINILGVFPMIHRVGAVRYLRAMAKVTRTYFNSDTGEYDDSEIKHAYAEVLAKSQYMRNRLTSIDRDLNESVSTISSKASFMPKMAKMFIPMGMMDRLVTIPGWIAGYEKGLDIHNGDEVAATDYADRLIRQSQGAGRAWDLAKITSDDSALGGKFGKHMTMFYNFFSAQLGTMRVQSNIAGRQISDGEVAKAAMTVTHAVFYVVVIPSLLEAMARGQCGDDPDASDYGYCAVKSSALFTGAFFPIFRSLLPATLNKFDPDIMSFGVKLSPVESSLEVISAMPEAAFNVVTGEANKADARNLIKGLGYLTGLPSAQMWRTLDAYQQLMDGTSDDWTDLLTGVPYD